MRSFFVIGTTPCHPRLRSRGRLALPAAAALSGLLLAALANAQAPVGEPLQRDTPRASMRGYLEAARADDYDRAAQFMDLRSLPPAMRDTPGTVFARDLKIVLDRTLWIDLDQLSDAPEGTTDDGLPGNRDLVGTIDSPKGTIPVLLERVRADEGSLLWKISSATVARVPALHQEFGYGPLGEVLPPFVFEIRFLEIQLWQWIGILVLIVAAAAASWILTAAASVPIRNLVKRSRTAIDDELVVVAAGPVRLLIAVGIFAGATYLLGLAVPVQSFLAALQRAFSIVAVAWLLTRLTDLAAQAAEQRLVARGQAIAMSVVPLGRRTVKALVIGIAALAALQNFGVNVTGILAGLGIGGLAVALAAQKTVENLFGGITLIADRPVKVGDFCRFGDRVGTVEEVGLRSTRVRTLDRTVVTVPNAEFAAMQLENFKLRDRIWFHPVIGLRYETTPDQMRHVLVELKRMLASHPKVDPEPARVRFTGFGAYSLDLEIFAYVLTDDINEFLAVQEDLLLRIMDVVEESGTGFAFPSQTIYAGKDGGLSVEKQRAAEERVRRWRESNELNLPWFKREDLSKLRGKLDYPPKGSVMVT
jgi:MscS family membrane protein